MDGKVQFWRRGSMDATVAVNATEQTAGKEGVL
jgi:hypothetical protein